VGRARSLASGSERLRRSKVHVPPGCLVHPIRLQQHSTVHEPTVPSSEPLPRLFGTFASQPTLTVDRRARRYNKGTRLGGPRLRSEAPVRELVYRLLNPLGFVAFKMGRRQGGPSRTGVRGRISKAIRNPRATRSPAHFQRNPLGRGQLAVFPRCSLDPYQLRYGRFARALKNSQLTCGETEGI
jgi:hypothetical protein